MERALAEAQRVLLEREREVTKLRTERHDEVGVVEVAELSELETKLERANERVEQLRVCACACSFHLFLLVAWLHN